MLVLVKLSRWFYAKPTTIKKIEHVCSVLDIYVFVNSAALNQIDRQPIFIVLPPSLLLQVENISGILSTKATVLFFSIVK